MVSQAVTRENETDYDSDNDARLRAEFLALYQNQKYVEAVRIFKQDAKAIIRHADLEFAKVIARLGLYGRGVASQPGLEELYRSSANLLCVAGYTSHSACLSLCTRIANNYQFPRNDSSMASARKHLRLSRDVYKYYMYDDVSRGFDAPLPGKETLDLVSEARSNNIFDPLVQHVANDLEVTDNEIHFFMREFLRSFCEARIWDEESHSERKGWYKTWCLAQARKEGYTISDLETSIAATGPRYLATDEQGVPIFGRVQHHDEFAAPGFESISSIIAKNGDIQVVGPVTEPGKTPKVSMDDVVVALYLAFSEDKPVFPSFSLEHYDSKRSNFNRLVQKEFSPGYLGQTNFGKTTYYTDFLMKGLAMGPAIASVADPVFSQTHKELDGALPQAIVGFCQAHDKGGAKDEDMNGRLAFHLKEFSFKIAQGVYVIEDVGLAIDSSNIIMHEDGTEDRSVNRGDPNTRGGRFSQYFAENYEEIAQVIPEFERLRQLFGLVHTLTLIRDDGYEINAGLRGVIENFRSSLSKPPSKLEIVAKPYHRDGCICEGGVTFESGKRTGKRYTSLEQAIEDERSRANATRQQVTRIAERRETLENAGEATAPIGHTLDTFEMANRILCKTEKSIGYVDRSCIHKPDINYQEAVGVLTVGALAAGLTLYKAGQAIKKTFDEND